MRLPAAEPFRIADAELLFYGTADVIKDAVPVGTRIGLATADAVAEVGGASPQGLS